MSDIASAPWAVVYTTGSLLWMAAWALVLGYAFSSAIQLFVKPAEAADRLGQGTVREVGLAAGRQPGHRVGVVLWIVLGWQFPLAPYLGGAILVSVMVVLVRVTYPERLAEERFAAYLVAMAHRGRHLRHRPAGGVPRGRSHAEPRRHGRRPGQLRRQPHVLTQPGSDRRRCGARPAAAPRHRSKPHPDRRVSARATCLALRCRASARCPDGRH